MPPVGMACAFARAKLSQYVSDLRTTSLAEKAGSTVKAGYLANIKSTERNVIGNSVQALTDLTIRNSAAAIDYLEAVVKSAATGGKMAPHEFRQIAGTLNIPGLKASAKGWKEGLREMVQILRTQVDPERMASKFDHADTHFENPVQEKVVRGIFNWMGAQDRPFWQFANQTSLYGRARLAGIRAGLKGDALSEYTSHAMANATDDMIIGAAEDANYATYKNPTILSEWASDMRQGIRRRAANAEPGRRLTLAAGQLGLDLTIPFTRVPSAIASVAVDYSPLGFAKAIAEVIEPNPKMQGAVVTKLLRASAGTAMTYWGIKAQQSGNATGSMPKDAGERARWELEGKGPNMFKLGGKWRNVTWLGPMAIPFLVGANIGAAEEMDLKGKLILGATFTGKVITEMTFLTSVKSIIEGLTDPERGGARAVTQVGVPVPSLVNQAAQSVDPVQRVARTIKERVMAKIPFASRSLPPRLGPFGDTLKRSSGVAAFIDASAARPATDDEITRELARLEVNPGRVGTTVRMGKEKVKRTQWEVNDLTSEFGPIKRAVLKEIIGDPAYQALDDEEKKKTLEAALRDVSGTATDIDKARRSGETVPRTNPSEFLSNPGVQ